jgi:hypothetical protein
MIDTGVIDTGVIDTGVIDAAATVARMRDGRGATRGANRARRTR